MALLNSQASVLADSDGQIDSVEDLGSVGSDPEAVIVDVPNDDNNEPTRRRKWAIFRKDNDDPSNDKKDRGLSFTCRCKSAVQASCLITCSSIIELIGNLLALVYGIAFIQSACNFYTLDTDPEKRAKEYDEKLDRVLFLEKNRVGFVGLLATCLVGLVVSFLMPIGTIYRSWKSLRAAMSLLLSMCLAHIILASIYLSDNELMATLAAIPFRVYEIFIIYNHINYYKRKKLEDARKALEGQDADGDNQNDKGAASNNADANNGASDQKDNPLASDMKVQFDMSKDEFPEEPAQDDDDDNADDKLKKDRKAKKRRMAQRALQGEKKNPNFMPNFIVQADPPEYK